MKSRKLLKSDFDIIDPDLHDNPRQVSQVDYLKKSLDFVENSKELWYYYFVIYKH